MKVIGIERKKGTYEGREYDNIVLTCTAPYPEEKEASGYFAETVKVKYSVFVETDIDINDDIIVNYNKFGQVKELVRKE